MMNIVVEHAQTWDFVLCTKWEHTHYDEQVVVH